MRLHGVTALASRGRDARLGGSNSQRQSIATRVTGLRGMGWSEVKKRRVRTRHDTKTLDGSRSHRRMLSSRQAGVSALLGSIGVRTSGAGCWVLGGSGHTRELGQRKREKEGKIPFLLKSGDEASERRSVSDGPHADRKPGICVLSAPH